MVLPAVRGIAETREINLRLPLRAHGAEVGENRQPDAGGRTLRRGQVVE